MNNPALACDRSGAGPPVVLVHGVGIGPWSYATLAEELARDHEVVVAHRRGYGRSADLTLGANLDIQVDDLVGLAGGPAAFIGVSGGATLVLALALAHPDLVTAAVIHEPVLGALAPELHSRVGAAAARLANSTGEAGVIEFMHALIGPAAWTALSVPHRTDVAARQTVLRTEVPHFLAFSPLPSQLGALAHLGVVNSVGAMSPGPRHHAADVIATYTSRPPRRMAGAGHLAQLDAPAALAATLRAAEDGLAGPSVGDPGTP